MNGINHAGSLCMLSDSPNNVSFYHSQGVSHSTTVTGMDVRMYSGWLVGNSRPDICSLCSSSFGGCLSLVYGVDGRRPTSRSGVAQPGLTWPRSISRKS